MNVPVTQDQIVTVIYHVITNNLEYLAYCKMGLSRDMKNLGHRQYACRKIQQILKQRSFSAFQRWFRTEATTAKKLIFSQLIKSKYMKYRHVNTFWEAHDLQHINFVPRKFSRISQFSRHFLNANITHFAAFQISRILRQLAFKNITSCVLTWANWSDASAVPLFLYRA